MYCILCKLLQEVIAELCVATEKSTVDPELTNCLKTLGSLESSSHEAVLGESIFQGVFS